MPIHLRVRLPARLTAVLPVAVLTAVASCTGQPAPPRRPAPPPSAAADPSPAAEAPAVIERPEWKAAFDRLGIDGAIAVLDMSANQLLVYRPDRVDTAYPPASTFKIPNSIIALETGVVTDASFTLPWDQVTRSIESWNRDHDLRSALRHSVVWYYQEVARRIGAERMAAWLARLDYGNRSLAGGIDQFWLRGGMRISPRQQIAFVRRLDEGTLPIAARTRDILRDIMILEQTPDVTLRAKTGWALPGTPDEVGWLVGWVERGDRTAYFATVVLDPPDGKMLTSRLEVSRAILSELGLLDASAAP